MDKRSEEETAACLQFVAKVGLFNMRSTTYLQKDRHWYAKSIVAEKPSFSSKLSPIVFNTTVIKLQMFGQNFK